MDHRDFLESVSDQHEAARVLHGLAFFKDLRKQAAAVAPVEDPAQKAKFDPAVSALNTPAVGAKQVFPVAPGQKQYGAGAGTGLRKRAFLQYLLPSAGKAIGKAGTAIREDLHGLAESGRGYADGLSAFSKHSVEAAKPDLGSRTARFKAWITGKKTPEQLAHARGPEYYSAFIKAKRAQQGVGAGDVFHELNAAVRNERGNITPMSAVRGAIDTGVLSKDTLADIGRKSLGYATGRTEQAAAAERGRRIALGAGLAGGGALAGGLVASQMAKNNR